MIARRASLPRRWSTLALFIALVTSLSACGGGGGSDGGVTTPITPGGSGPVATTAVTIKNTSFTPPSIIVSPGATVSFSNQDGIAHNVTFSSGAVHGAGDFTGGSVDIAMPTTPGTYTYSCTLHGGMNGSVTVQ